jgi:hypothetical protein
MSKKRKKYVVNNIQPKSLSFVPMLGQKYKVYDQGKDSKINSDVMKSSDYEKFSILEQNRVVNDKHVNELVVSIQNSGQLTPIIINENFEIIDGQHRFDACRILKIPVMYLISYKTSINEVILMNNTQKSWKLHDYLRCFSDNKWHNHETYQKVDKFMREHDLKLTTCIVLLSEGTGGGGSTGTSLTGQGLISFRKGTYKIGNLARAQAIAKILSEIKAFAPDLVGSDRFCRSYCKLSSEPKWNHDSAVYQIKKYRRKYDGASSKEEALQGLLAVYNYNQLKSKKISIRKDGY